MEFKETFNKIFLMILLIKIIYLCIKDNILDSLRKYLQNMILLSFQVYQVFQLLYFNFLLLFSHLQVIHFFLLLFLAIILIKEIIILINVTIFYRNSQRFSFLLFMIADLKALLYELIYFFFFLSFYF